MDQNMYGNQYGQEQGEAQQSEQQPSAYYEAPYSAPQPQPVYQEQPQLEPPVTMGEWLISLLLMCIPCVNIVLMFVWAFGSTTNKSKSNFFKAALIWYGIMIVLSIVMTVLMVGGMLAAAM